MAYGNKNHKTMRSEIVHQMPNSKIKRKRHKEAEIDLPKEKSIDFFYWIKIFLEILINL